MMSDIIRLFVENPEFSLVIIFAPIVGFILLLIVVWRIIKDILRNSSIKELLQIFGDISRDIKALGGDVKSLNNSLIDQSQKSQERLEIIENLINKTSVENITALHTNTESIINLRLEVTKNLAEVQNILKDLDQKSDSSITTIQTTHSVVENQNGVLERIEKKLSEISEHFIDGRKYITSDELKQITEEVKTAVVEEVKHLYEMKTIIISQPEVSTQTSVTEVPPEG